MTFGALALCAALFGSAQVAEDLPNPDGGQPRLEIIARGERLEQVKSCPKYGWEFDNVIAGLGRPVGDQPFFCKFSVFSQGEGADLSKKVCRLLLRLWDYNAQILRLNHASAYNGGIIDVYLCNDGKAGGEQLFTFERRGSNRVKVNAIYIYDIKSFTNPIEMVRELAHEYGHATLPAVGTFEQPEDWANGHLGERLYLRWLRDDLVMKRLEIADTLGASIEQLGSYVKKNVQPLVAELQNNGPNPKLYEHKGQAAMNQYLGMVLLADEVFASKPFARSLLLNADGTHKGYASSLIEASEEQEVWSPKLEEQPGKKIWLPIGKGSVSGAKVLRRAHGWAQLLLSSKPVLIRNVVD